MSIAIKSLSPFIRLGERVLFISSNFYGTAGSGANVALKHSRIMKKLMTGSSRSRKKLYSVEQTPSKSFTEFGLLSGKTMKGTAGKSNKSLRRVQVLNTIFMEHITGLMSTGEVSLELVGKGVTVSMVKVSNDFSKVNVYWYSAGTDADKVLEPLLSKAGGKLRHELSQLRVIGIVPPIQFVRDKTFSKLAEVQTLLDRCDFGDDFSPTPSKNLFAQPSPTPPPAKPIPKKFQNSTPLPVELGSETLEEINYKPPRTEVDLYNDVSMRQDMLGVRHDVIMTEVKQMISKIVKKQTQTRPREETEYTMTEAIEENPDIGIKSNATCQSEVMRDDRSTLTQQVEKQRRDDFFKYLLNQQLARAKELKRESTLVKEREFYETEAFQRWKTMMEDNLDSDGEDNEDDYFQDFGNENLSRYDSNEGDKV